MLLLHLLLIPLLLHRKGRRRRYNHNLYNLPAPVAGNAKPAQDNASVKSASPIAPASPQTAKEHRAPELNIAEKPAAQASAAKPVEGIRETEQNDTSAKTSAPRAARTFGTGSRFGVG